MVYVFLAEGFEEMEALCPVDILRRGGIAVKTVGISTKTVTGSHSIPVVCDITEDEAVRENLQAVVLPGGIPGTPNLEQNKTVQKFLDYAAKNNLIIAAICAAPSILGHKGLLQGKKAVSAAGYEKDLTGALVCNVPAVQDGNIITGWGAGGAFEFSFALLTALTGDKEKADKLRQGMKYPL